MSMSQLFVLVEFLVTKKICFVVSDPMTASSFLRLHFLYLSKKHDVTLIANFSLRSYDKPDFLKVINVPISRKVRVLNDIFCLFQLIFVFRRGGFDVVHSVTPKAGLLSMIAAFIVNIPFRFHTYTGQVWANKTGFARFLYKLCDGIIFRLSTFVLVDSSSQRTFLSESGVISRRKSAVLASGSISGVDLKRFAKDGTVRRKVRHEIGISESSVMFLYIGRINKDKGIQDLVHAFSSLQLLDKDACLVIVGPDEGGVLNTIEKKVRSCGGNIYIKGYTDSPESYMAASDVFCLPSYREGFGSVIIEAAACGVPALASRIYGITDAVVEGETGLLHEAGNSSDIRAGMLKFINDVDLTLRMGDLAYKRAHLFFDSHTVSGALVDFYDKATKSNS